MKQHTKDFIKVLDSIKYSKSRHEVFNDWLILTAASLYAPWKKCQEIENEYLEIANKYTKDELDKHSHLLAITVEALEEKEQDFLGEVFTFGELGNSRTGQFFTPYHISYLMAEIAIGENEIPDNRILKINEPTCGSGGMVIASIEVLKKRGFDYQNNAYFVCQDIDARCARMTYIQLSLLAAPAVIICGNTLTFETYWQRFTFGYYKSGMDFRLKAEKMLDLMTETIPFEQNQIEEKSMEIKLPASRDLSQGELFQ